MIEMKDFQEVQSEDDWNDEEIMSTTNFDVEGGGRTGLAATSRGGRRKRNTRYMLIGTVTILFLAAVVGYFVGGIYLSDDEVETLLEHDSGIVENNVENEKQEEQKNHMVNGRPGNPLIDKMNNYHNNNPKYNHNFGQHPSAGAGGVGGNNFNMNQHNGLGFGGHNGHQQGGRIPGGFADHKTQSSNNQDMVTMMTDPPLIYLPTNPPNSVVTETEPTGQEQSSDNLSPLDAIVDEKDVYCEDLNRYRPWYEQPITKGDGIMYTIVKQFDHDAAAFTYV
jgi:hypothetical protein